MTEQTSQNNPKESSMRWFAIASRVLMCFLVLGMSGSAHAAENANAWGVFATWGTGVNTIHWSESGMETEIKGASTFQLGVGRDFSLGNWAVGAIQGSWLHVSGKDSISIYNPLFPISVTIDRADDHFLLQGAMLFSLTRESNRRWALGPTVGTILGHDGIVKSGSLTFGGRALVTFIGKDGSWSVGLDYLLMESYPIDGKLQFVSLYASKNF
jgi:hypothetical protein